jgi:hypothetical protein
MRKLTFITTLAVLLLAGCAHPDHGRMPPPPYGSCPCPNPANPQVTVDGGTIKLDQEILVFAPGVRGSVTWSLPANGPFRFPENGIVIEGKVLDQMVRGKPVSVALDPDQKEIVDCRPSADGLQFSCFNNHTIPGVYKYTIRVRSGDAVIQRDPPAVNM